MELLPRYAKVTIPDVVRALETYFLPLFDAKKSVAVIVSAPGKADGVADALTASGFEVERREMVVEEGEEGEDSEDGSDSDSGSDSGGSD